MSDSNISFSKEIANTIGLEEAIILEYIKKTENSTDGISITQITSDIKFWSYQTIEEVLSSLIKTGLIIESTIENELYFSSKKPNQNKNSIPENKWKPNKEILDQINEYGIPEDFAQLQIDDFKQLNLEKSDEEINWGVKFLRFVIKKWRYKDRPGGYLRVIKSGLRNGDKAPSAQIEFVDRLEEVEIDEVVEEVTS